VPVLGTAAINIFLLSALGLWLLQGNFKMLLVLARQCLLARMSLGLFLWLGLSALWSSNFSENILYLSKYREFFMIPVFMLVFQDKITCTYGSRALFAGIFILLAIVFLQYFHVINLNSRFHSSNNWIYHGIVISFFGYWCLDLACKNSKYAIFFILLFLASGFSVFVIHGGRTGYILFFMLTLLFVLQRYNWRFLFLTFIVGLGLYLFSDLRSLLSLNLSFLKESSLLLELQKSDVRFEFYLNSLKIIRENFIFGVGLGDFKLVYSSLKTNNFFPNTTNPHNEYLMIWVQSGLIGFSLFIVFLWAFLRMTQRLSKDDAPLAVATLVTIIVSCAFNSSFLDMNDGAFLVILSALFLAPGVKLIHPR